MVGSIAATGARPPVPQNVPPGAATNAVPETAPDTSRGPAYVVGSAAELNAKLRAQALDAIGKAAKPDDGVTIGPDGMETRRVRDANGRVFDERRMRDPKTGRTLFLEFAPTDGLGGKVSISVGNKYALISFREKDLDSVPWDLVGKAQGELIKEQKLQAGDYFSFNVRVLP